MRRKKLISILIAISVFALIGFFGVRLMHQNSKVSKVEINGHIVTVELATTIQGRTKGLMGRDFLSPDAGMLFVYQSDGTYVFWMKNTLIPLDMIWIDKDKKIVFIKEDARPCDEDMKKLRVNQCPYIVPNSMARYILEVNSGWVAKNGIKVGDTVTFKDIND